MNLYQLIWDEMGYARRRRKILATKATEDRKLVALVRLWNRMNLTAEKRRDQWTKTS
jgi:hypothetical protein